MPINSNSYNTLFLTEQALKDNSIIDANVDMGILSPMIFQVQQLQIEPLLGTGLYSHLQDAISATACTEAELFLLSAFIQPAMIAGIMVDAPFSITYKFKNKGVELQSSENSEVPTRDSLEFLSDRYKSIFGAYAERLIKHIEANRSLFPSYRTEESCDDIRPKPSGYRSRIALGNKHNRYNRYR